MFRGLRLKDGARRLLCADMRITEQRAGAYRAFLFLTVDDREFTFWLWGSGVWSPLYRRWQ